MREVGFTGGFAAFVRHLHSRPEVLPQASAETLLAGYRDIAKRIDPELPLRELPRAPYGSGRCRPARATPA